MKKIVLTLIGLSLLVVLFRIINEPYSITLPNNYTIEESGDSGKARIYGKSGNIRMEDVLDFFVDNDFVYGSEIKTHSYFILNTKNDELHYPLNNKQYISLRERYNLKDGYVSNAVNIYELREKLKEPYWID